ATDEQRLDALCDLLGDGRHVLACGIWTPAALRANGGFGYDHLLTAVAPALRARGVDPRPLLVDEPARLLAR
ncbi:MAG: phosphotriesterase-related protein, partial [Solirubrobacteraceae bacterium]|nr:phosphotriesterase-related protein [Solirubrobacteraceae bacterium]